MSGKDYNDEDWPKIEGKELCAEFHAEKAVTLITPNGYRHGQLSRFSRQGKVYVRFLDSRERSGEFINDHSMLRWGWL